MNKLGALSLFFVSLSACTLSTGQDGVQGKVRFSQVEHFVETTDFAPPIVTESGLLVELEFPNDQEEVNPDLELVVADENGTSQSANAEIMPLGFAQYAITLDKPGAYTLIARQDGSTLDTIDITASDASGMRFHGQVDRVVSDTSGNTACGASDQVDLGSATLTNDASLSFHVVPTDGSGNAMLGLLQLTAEATGPVELTGDYLGQGDAPNSFTVTPSGALGAPAQITVKDEITGKSISFTLPTSNTTLGCK